MLKCVNCQYVGTRFSAHPSGISHGAFTYVAVCPRCGSRMTKHLPGYHISDLQIGFALGAPDPSFQRRQVHSVSAGLLN